MKRNITLLLLCVLAGCCMSCEKDIEFNGTITRPFLVLNSILTPDSAVTVHLSQSRFVLGETTEMPPITDAMVSVFVNGNLKEQLVHIENGIYKGICFPKTGDEIKIEVVADGYDKVTSQAVIPEKPNVTVTDSVITIREDKQISPYQSNTEYTATIRDMRVQLKLTDPADEDNYYYIKATRSVYYYDELVIFWTIELELSEVLKRNVSDNDNFFDELFGDDYYTNGIDNLFTDQFVNGKDILFDLSFSDVLESARYTDGEKFDEGTETVEGVRVEDVIEIGGISRDLYQYVISVNKAENANDSPFAEPVRVHTNIENGIGILGACSTYRFVSVFEMNYIPYF